MADILVFLSQPTELPLMLAQDKPKSQYGTPYVLYCMSVVLTLEYILGDPWDTIVI